MKPVLDMIGLVTNHMAESLRFYGLLGVDVPEFKEDEPYLDAALPNGVRISWNRLDMVKDIDKEWVQPVGQQIALAFLCDSPSEVDALCERITQAGFKTKMAPFDAFWGCRWATMLDPDGNGVDLFAYLTS